MLYGSGYNWLDWLEYNIKRALLIEYADEAERKMSISQVHQTIERIAYYHSAKESLLQQLTLLH